jgi:hypothetical protein
VIPAWLKTLSHDCCEGDRVGAGADVELLELEAADVELLELEAADDCED